MASTITHTETMAAADAIYEAAALFQGGGDAIVPESDVAQIVAQKVSATKAAANFWNILHSLNRAGEVDAR